jgi:opacity protein-like surface antigen
MRNIFPIIVVVAALAAAPERAAIAQAGTGADGRNIYLGGAIGRSAFDADFSRTVSVIQRTGATQGTVTANVYDTVWKSYLGYQISPSFSVEAGYWSLGQLGISAGITAPANAVLQRTYRADGYGVNAVFWSPTERGMTALVKAGAIQTTTKASAGNPGAGLLALPAESASGLNAHWGAGLEFRLAPATALRFEYENVRRIGDDAKFGTANVNLWTFGANYKF